MDVIGRIESSAWVYIQAIGGSNPCWVNASLVKITGDLLDVEIVYPGKALLPVSPYYPPVSWVYAIRNDATVTVSWNDIPLRAGDEEDEFMQHYIVEVWRCEGGQLLFEPIGTNNLFDFLYRPVWLQHCPPTGGFTCRRNMALPVRLKSPGHNGRAWRFLTSYSHGHGINHHT